MVEVEAQCAALRRRKSSSGLLPVTLILEGEELLKLSELKRLLQFIDPLIQAGADLHVFCESSATQKLLEFCGLQLVSELNKGRTPDYKS